MVCKYYFILTINQLAREVEYFVAKSSNPTAGIVVRGNKVGILRGSPWVLNNVKYSQTSINGDLLLKTFTVQTNSITFQSHLTKKITEFSIFLACNYCFILAITQLAREVGYFDCG